MIKLIKKLGNGRIRVGKKVYEEVHGIPIYAVALTYTSQLKTGGIKILSRQALIFDAQSEDEALGRAINMASDPETAESEALQDAQLATKMVMRVK